MRISGELPMARLLRQWKKLIQLRPNLDPSPFDWSLHSLLVEPIPRNAQGQ
jgi:hypothetical protein